MVFFLLLHNPVNFFICVIYMYLFLIVILGLANHEIIMKIYYRKLMGKFMRIIFNQSSNQHIHDIFLKFVLASENKENVIFIVDTTTKSVDESTIRFL